MFNLECDVKKAKSIEQYLMKKHKAIKKEVIGKTILNRDITAYILGKGGAIMCGAFHGMERVSAMLLYKFLDDVCKSGTKVNLTIVPMVNPDGVEISVNGTDTAGYMKGFVTKCLKDAHLSHTCWQANARGVDINHNFDAGFLGVKSHEKRLGILSGAPTRYGGTHPESERETSALCELCRKNDYDIAVALHTQGREIYYDFGDKTKKESETLAHNMAKLSGYTVSHPEGIAVGGGFKDWFIEQFNRPAFTLECGLGKNPLDPRVFYTEYGVVSKMLFYILKESEKKRR